MKPLAEIAPSVSDPYKAYKVASPKTIPGNGEHKDLTIYNVTTDFWAIDKAHKRSLVPKTEAKSAYTKLLPDVSKVPRPGELFPGPQRREEIINEGTIDEVMPFLAGPRIAIAKMRAKQHHRKAQSALRRIHVAYNAADGAVNHTDHLAPDDEFRPRTLREKAIAKRMGRLIRRANHHNLYGNIFTEMFPYKDSPPVTGLKQQPFEEVDFDRDSENLSFFEKGHRLSSRRLHNMRRSQSDKLIHGYRIPFTNKRLGLLSFDSLAAGGPGNPFKSIEKRDDAIRKAEALRKQAAANRLARQAMASEVQHDMQLAKDDIKTAANATAKASKKAAKKTAELSIKTTKMAASKSREVATAAKAKSKQAINNLRKKS